MSQTNYKFKSNEPTPAPDKRSSDEADNAAAAPVLTPRVLIVDDDPIAAEGLAEFLSRENYQTLTATNSLEALELVDAANSPNATGTQPVGLVISDVNLSRLSGLELLKRIRSAHPQVVVIMITGFAKIEQAIEAIKLGAADYLTKPIIDNELKIAVSKAMRQYALLAENQSLRDQLRERFGMGNIVGSDYRMQKVYDLIEAVAATKTTVLIDGQSGTGKTVIARAIHDRSPRQAAPFVTFACGAIPETLLESELFGHVKGAFTGADNDKPGKILSADHGTLFIDEINSATPALQLKLLRVLQERQFEPVGSNRTISVNVRFILATNQPLADLVKSGMFREDLFYRINVVSVHLPPLSQRVGDIPALAEHFLNKWSRDIGKTVTGFTPAAMQALHVYHWPGNVRELENAIERAVVLSRRPVVDITDLPDSIQQITEEVIAGSPHRRQADALGTTSSNGTVAPGCGVSPALAKGWTPSPLVTALMEPEKQIILAALRANGWNRQETAKQLEINRTTLYKKMKQLGLEETL